MQFDTMFELKIYGALIIAFTALTFFFNYSCNSQEIDSSNKEIIDTNEQVSQAEKIISPPDENKVTDDKLSQAEENLSPNTINADQGKELFQSKGCVACHTFGKGKLVGPDLLGVTKKREEEWLKKWLKDPEGMLKTDPIAKEMLKEFFVPMPNQGLNDEEINSIISYMKEEDSKQ